MTFGRYFVHRPLLIGRHVVDAVFERVVVHHVQLVATVGPRDEDDVAALVVEREVPHVEGAVGLNERRVEPEDLAVRLHDSVRHVFVVAIAGAVARNETKLYLF